MKVEESFWIELQNKIAKEIPRLTILKRHFIEQLDTTIKEIIAILSSVPNGYDSGAGHMIDLPLKNYIFLLNTTLSE